MLVYCDEDFVKYLKNNEVSFVDVDRFIDVGFLRNLDQKNNDRYSLMIATIPDPAMRGTDYRSRKVGIELFVMKSFSFRREAY